MERTERLLQELGWEGALCPAVEESLLRSVWEKKKSSKPKPWMREKVERMLLEIPVRSWFIQKKYTRQLYGMTYLELNLVTHTNTLYLYHALEIPIKECMELAKHLGLTMASEQIAFSVAVEKIRAHPMAAIPKDELENVLKGQGLEWNVRYRPFGSNPLRGHPLQHVSLVETAAADLPVKFEWQRMTAMREKRTLELRVRLTVLNEYIIENESALLVKHLRELF